MTETGGNMRRAPIRIVHITDTHITAEAGAKVYGIDSFEALANLLSLVHQNPVKQDLIVATGDLSEDGTHASYQRFRSLVTPLAVPVYCIPGNHDARSVMDNHLRGGNVHIQRQVVLGQWQIVFLDSHIPGDIHGYLTVEELAALGKALQEMPDHYALVCLHHGPFPVCPMLPCCLENAEEFLAIIRRYPNVRCVLSGHNHCLADEQYDGVRILVTPSTFVQISHPTETDDQRAFWGAHSLDTGHQGLRHLELHSDGRITTEVTWVELL